jgi:type I restriction enzyme S subunit
MEVRQDCKLSDQENLPKFSGAWEVMRVIDIADCLDNLRIPLNESQRKQMKGDFPYCGANGVLDYVNDYVVDDDIILMAEDGGYFDEYAYRPIAYRMIGKCWVNNHAHILKAKNGYDQGFLFYALVHKNILSYLASGTRAKLNKSEMNKIEVYLPKDKLEQAAIATILSSIDDLISSLGKLIAKKRDIQQAAMQQLLIGQRRLPGFSGEWVTKSLMDIAESKKALFDDGDWVEAEHITDQGVRLIQTGNIGVGCFVEKTNRKYIYEESFESLKCKELKVGDILICRLAEPAGRACIFPDIGENKVITSVDVTIFRPRPEVANRNFLVQIFSTGGWFKSVLDQVGGTTHKRISRGALGRIKISLPHIDEQTAIATILSDMDSELAALEARRDKARLLKQGMMQELLTGRIRLINGTYATKGEMVT